MNTREKRRKRRRQQAMMKLWLSITAVIFLIVVIIFIVVKAVSCGSAEDSKAKDNKVKDTQTTEGLSVNETEAVTETELPSTESQVAEQEEVKYPEIIKDMPLIEKGGVIEIDGAGYELYTYREKIASSYAEGVTGLADSLAGIADVYDVVIPLSSQITFPDNLASQLDSSDQKAAIDSIYGLMGDNVKKVDAYDKLMQHRDEYVYFRTDHHWTALGAYYAYTALCESMEVEVKPISSYQTKQFDGFLGSFYNDTKSETMKANPDSIIAYVPLADSICHVTNKEGSTFDWPVINDVSSYKAGVKYSTFIAADNPITDIENKVKQDGSSCVVVKESFGNAFIPFLVDYYNHVYVIDYRYWQGNVAEYTKQVGASDVILLNNLSMIRNQYLVGQLTAVIQ